MDWDEAAGSTNDSMTEGPQQIINSVEVGDGDKNKLITAVSVSQVCKLTRPNEGLIIHGKKIYHVNLVAYVYEIITTNQTKIHLMVDDHSGGGPLEVSYIIGDINTPVENPSLSIIQDHNVATSSGSGDHQPRDIQSVRPGDYIRCVGVVKFTQDKATVIAYHLEIIEDPNEITMHIMEVIRDSLFYQKLQASGGVMPAPKDEQPSGQQNQHQPQNQQHNQGQQSGFGKLSTRDKHVMTFLKNKAGDKGIHIDEIVKNFTAFSKQDILESLITLSNEGLSWQSDNENVWCVGST